MARRFTLASPNDTPKIVSDCTGHEDCIDADFLRIDSAFRLTIGKDQIDEASKPNSALLDNINDPGSHLFQ